MTTLNSIDITKQKVATAAAYQALITGINTLLPGVDPFVLGNTTISRADLLSKLESMLAADTTTKSAQVAYHNAVQAERALLTTIGQIRAQLKLYLLSRFGKTSTQLQSFGFVPNKVPDKPVTSKSTGVAKSLATRKARGTMGKKQKSTIHGTLTAAPLSGAAPTSPGSTTTEVPTSPTATPTPTAPGESPVGPAPVPAPTAPVVKAAPTPTVGGSS